MQLINKYSLASTSKSSTLLERFAHKYQFSRAHHSCIIYVTSSHLPPYSLFQMDANEYCDLCNTIIKKKSPLGS